MKKDIAIRAGKTFLQAFLSTVALGVAGVVDLKSAQALAIAGVAAGLSATWNFVVKSA